jgi:CubicO group peptidase (beta-lactamase class C family)
MQGAEKTTWNRLDEFVEQAMKSTGVPGASVGLLHNGEAWTGGFGVTNADHPLPVTDDTLHQIGSITKTFTGTLAMRLVEEGKLDLDATVRTYLPEFKVADEDASARATVRHLMTHTGGWVGDLFEDTGSGDDALPKYIAKMAGLEQLAPIGTVWSYNNAGFAVLGRIIEVVTGKRYVDVLREMLLEPLGLQATHFDPDPVITQRFAVGHRVTPQGAQVIPSWILPGYVRPMGAIVCSAKDLLRYARFHLGDGTTEDGERLLTQESLSQMHAPHANVWGDAHWGLTWSVDETAVVRRISHGGGTAGQISLLTLVPERDFAVAVLSNADRGSVLTRDVTEWALKEVLGVEIERPVSIESTERDLTQYVGVYKRPFADLELGMLGERLIGQITYKQSFPTADSPPPPPTPPFSLTRCEKDRLLVMDGPYADTTADVIRKEDGTIGWIRVGRIHVREGWG